MLPYHSLLLKGIREQTEGSDLQAGLKQKPQRRTAYWLSSHGLLILHSYSTHGHMPRADTIHSELVLFNIIWSLLYILCYTKETVLDFLLCNYVWSLMFSCCMCLNYILNMAFSFSSFNKFSSLQCGLLHGAGDVLYRIL